MEKENNVIKKENEDHIETLLIKPFIEEERDLPEYIDINAISSANPKSDTVEQTFKCTECSIKYKKLEYLVIHTAVHNPRMSCPLCCQSFTCRKQFRLHINCHVRNKMNNDKKVIYKCSYCSKSFNTKKKHTIHLRVHTNERPHKCGICGEGFKQLGALKDHKVTHTKERNYVCEICNGGYTTSSSLKRHKRRIHERGRTMNCNLCNAEFQNRADYKAHRTTVHPSIIFKRSCPLCSTMFFSKRAYKTHKELHIEHIPTDRNLFKNFLCNLCGKETDSLKIFSEHRRRHLGYTNKEMKKAMTSKLFHCKLCSFVYRNKESLLKHTGMHEAKTLKCDLCQESYTYFGLREHKRKVHQILDCRVCHKFIARSEIRCHYQKYHHSRIKRHQCILCGKNCATRTMLKYHHRVKHQIKSASLKNFKCGVCGKRFLTQDAKVRHKEDLHSIKVKFKCSQCGSIFKSLKGINIHKLRHRDISRRRLSARTTVKVPKRFRCKVCKKIFQCLKNYKTHMFMKTCVHFFSNHTKSETKLKTYTVENRGD